MYLSTVELSLRCMNWLLILSYVPTKETLSGATRHDSYATKEKNSLTKKTRFVYSQQRRDATLKQTSRATSDAKYFIALGSEKSKVVARQMGVVLDVTDQNG
jgi:hypothetical protein